MSTAITINLDRRTVMINADKWNAGEKEVKASGNKFICASRDATVVAPMHLLSGGQGIIVEWYLNSHGELIANSGADVTKYGFFIPLPISDRVFDDVIIEGDWPQAEIDAAVLKAEADRLRESLREIATANIGRPAGASDGSGTVELDPSAAVRLQSIARAALLPKKRGANG